MTMKIKEIFKKLLKRIGYEIKVYNPANQPARQIVSALNHVNTNIVFDIGANEGQFAQDIREFGYNGRIISFEPLTLAHKNLEKNAKSDATWDVHDRSAIGNENGTITINISENSVSSSILPMLEAHSKMSKKSQYTKTENIPLVKLDSIAPNYLLPWHNLFIKIDTQGYESQVLDGADETLNEACGILCELSLIPLYEGQAHWLEIVDRLEKKGFTLWALQNGFSDNKTGQILQMDGIFLKSSICDQV